MGADKVISVVFEEEKKKDDYINIIEVIMSAIGILSHELSNYEMAGSDDKILIRTKHMSLLDGSQIDYLYNLGYKKGVKELNRI